MRRLLCVLVALGFVLQPVSVVLAQTAVNVQTGSFTYDQIDLAIGRRAPVRLLRHYSTLNASAAGPFGPGTSFGLWSLKTSFVSATTVTLTLPTGELTRFTGPGNGTFTNAEADDELRGTLTVVGNLVTLTLESGTRLEFNGTGNGRFLTAVKDRYNVGISLSYTGNNLTKVVNSFGQGIILRYEGSPSTQVSSAQLVKNNTVLLSGFSVRYTYNSSGQLENFYNAIDGQTVNCVNSSGQLSTCVANGRTQYRYTGNSIDYIITPRGSQGGNYRGLDLGYLAGKVSQQKYPGFDPFVSTDDIALNYEYSGISGGQNSTTASITFNSVARKVRYNYTDLSYIDSVVVADADTTDFAFDTTRGLLTGITNARDFTTGFIYDQSGVEYHLTHIIEDDPSVVSVFNFDAPFGQLLFFTDPLTNSIAFDYDAATGDLLQTTTELPQFTNFTAYNGFGQYTSGTDGEGRAFAVEYTAAASDPVRVTGSDGLVRVYTYDDLSRVTSFSFATAPGDIYRYQYDSLGRVTKLTAPGLRETLYYYDDNGSLTAVRSPTTTQDPGGVVTFFAYDAMDRVKERRVGNRKETYTYSPYGDLASKTDANGWLTEYNFDTKGRLQTVSFRGLAGTADDSTLNYTYDELDRVKSVTDSLGANRNVSFTYYDDNTNISGPRTVTTGSDTLEYIYDKAGNLKAVKRNGANLLTYGYKQDNSLASAALAGSGLRVDFGYNEAGQLLSLVYPGVTGTYDYDPVKGDLRGVSFAKTGATLRSILYGYNYGSRGQLLTRTESGPSGTVSSLAASQSYSYNSLDELTRVVAGPNTYVYSYDAKGNPTQIIEPPSINTVPTYETGTDRLKTIANLTLLYDNNGNVIEQYDGTNRFRLTYNVRNQFTGWTATDNGGTVTSTLSVTYDALGRRISKTYKGVTTNYVNSGDQVIEETVGSTTRRHLVGLGLDEVYATRSTTSGVISEEYLLHDALNNSVVATVDALSKNVKSGFGYTPFGKGFATHSVATNNPLLFAGAEANEFGSAIHYLRGRFYSTALNRFLAEDPIGLAGGDTNLYRYVFNRPHVDYDPTGLGDEVVTLVGGVETDFFRPGSPFVVSVALGPGERFALQATLQSSVGATGTRGYLGTPEDVSVNPIGGVQSDLVTQAGNFGSYRVASDLVAQAGNFGSYRGEGACGNYAFSSIYCSDSLNPEQVKNLGRFNKSLPRNAGATKIYNLPNGGKAFQATSPARNIPGSYSIYEKQIDAIGRTLNFTITTIAPNGSVVKVATKFPRNVSPIYPNR